MNVPNYVPDQLEVPGNVAEQIYPLRMAFVKRVTLRHFVSISVIGLVSRLKFPALSLTEAIVVVVSLLLALELSRIVLRGKRIEANISTAVLPLVMASMGCLMQRLSGLGWPVWALLVGPLAAVIYSALCGRDYSFVGNYCLSVIASSVAIAAVGVQEHSSRQTVALGLVLNATYLFYVIYDLASIQSRRRIGEEWAAVTDLYRDVFNFSGYIRRVILHWQKHKIWNLTRT